jgi:acyl carrier protein
VTRDEIRSGVLRLVGEIAPEADLAGIRCDRDLREQVEMDSFDLLRLMVRFHETFGVDVPESNYRKLRSVDDAVAYLAARVRA